MGVVKGCDISACQGAIPDVHWRAIATDKRFVYIEARIGNDGDDADFGAYRAGSMAAGIVAGPYLYAECLPNDPAHPGRAPEDQAQAFFVASGGLGASAGELPPAIDLEDPPPERWGVDGCSPAFMTDWSGRCCAKVQSLFGVAPVVYTYPWWAKNAGLHGLDAYPLWLAVYGGSSYRTVPPWKNAAILQTGAGTYRLPNGIECDEDEIVDEATFQALLVRS